MPCTDTNECKEPLSNAAQTASHEKHEEEACGPFCACFCCGHIVSQNFQVPKITVAKPVIKERLQSFYDNISLPSDFFGNIWQPPKVS